MPTEDDFAGTGYFKGTDVKIATNRENFEQRGSQEFWTPERKKADFAFVLVGLAAFALLAYYGRK